MLKHDPSTAAGIEALINNDEPLTGLVNFNIIMQGRVERRDRARLIQFFEHHPWSVVIGPDHVTGPECVARLKNGAALEPFQHAQRFSSRWSSHER